MQLVRSPCCSLHRHFAPAPDVQSSSSPAFHFFSLPLFSLLLFLLSFPFPSFLLAHSFALVTSTNASITEVTPLFLGFSLAIHSSFGSDHRHSFSTFGSHFFCHSFISCRARILPFSVNGYLPAYHIRLIVSPSRPRSCSAGTCEHLDH